MNFNYKFYRFVYAKAPIDHMLNIEKAAIKESHLMNRYTWKKIRKCPFSKEFLDLVLHNIANVLHPPRCMVFYLPKNHPDLTFAMHTWDCLLAERLGDYDDKLEMLSLRFTTKFLPKNEGAIRELCYYRGNKLQRIIRVMEDPRWDLWVDGEQQPFEEGKSYEKIKRKLIRDYFTMDDMTRFATNWGCPFDQDEFWDSDQPMYVFGGLENDENLADWQERNVCVSQFNS